MKNIDYINIRIKVFVNYFLKTFSTVYTFIAHSKIEIIVNRFFCHHLHIGVGVLPLHKNIFNLKMSCVFFFFHLLMAHFFTRAVFFHYLIFSFLPFVRIGHIFFGEAIGYPGFSKQKLNGSILRSKNYFGTWQMAQLIELPLVFDKHFLCFEFCLPACL